MLLALFLIDLAAGLYLFLPLVGRRNAGVKFYRLILITSGGLAICARVASQLAHSQHFSAFEAMAVGLTIIVYVTLRYPKRLIFRIPAALLGIVYIVAPVIAWREATHASILWSIAGALSSVAILGSVTLAMLLGHWYLVVRGMPIDPLKRLTFATLGATIVKIVVVVIAIVAGGAWYEVAIRQGIFFWMRAGWGLAGPLLLYPMVWGTVKIRSTMAATGILYVDVVAVVIGEVLGAWLSAIVHLPV
ncbi:MAG TPA: hypothetical protein VGQ46_18165 [Thermoanaerobaculia bacterium]|jgi:hypothetical protein|nr:hypothetical protein [Thermoanaerobaculia bacterium]